MDRLDISMNEWTGRKFWQDARIRELPEGFGIQIDSNFAMTPAKNLLAVPYLVLAEKICAEFKGQEEKINPATMPFTRLTNTTIDRVPVTRSSMIEALLNYGETDLLCYRTNSPPELIEWQSKNWDPVLVWLEEEFAIRIKTGQGILPFTQDSNAIKVFRDRILTLDHYKLSGLSSMVPLLGSLMLGLGYLFGYASKDTIWKLSRIDEDWQEQKWGVDPEAQQVTEKNYNNFLVASFFVDLTLG